MPWIVGIDEAGYGPNLGPFVMTAVACRVPEVHADADLWNVLRGVTRRHSESADDRFLVADSKLVYTPGRGLGCLEMTVHAAVPSMECNTLAGFVDRVCPACHPELHGESWYDGATSLPVAAAAEDCARAAQSLSELCQDLDIGWGHISSVVVCPKSFNATLDERGSKGAVLAKSLVRLLRVLPRDDEPLRIYIDKHGGRNSYAATLQPAFDDGLVISGAESSQRSVYHLAGSERPVEITIEPRADTRHFCVALASMVSKYLRELLMLEFNRYWQGKVPGLKPTAGYPLDAKRFWSDIRPAMRRLKLQEDMIWRRK